MDDELTPEQQFAAEDPKTMVPRELARGRSREELIYELVRLDWTPDAAARFVDRAADDLRRFRESPESRQELLREAHRDMRLGCGLTMAGGAFLVVMFILAWTRTPYFIFIGAELGFGLVLFARGHSRWKLYRHESPGAMPTALGGHVRRRRHWQSTPCPRKAVGMARSHEVGERHQRGAFSFCRSIGSILRYRSTCCHVSSGGHGFAEKQLFSRLVLFGSGPRGRTASAHRVASDRRPRVRFRGFAPAIR